MIKNNFQKDENPQEIAKWNRIYFRTDVKPKDTAKRKPSMPPEPKYQEKSTRINIKENFSELLNNTVEA